MPWVDIDREKQGVPFLRKLYFYPQSERKIWMGLAIRYSTFPTGS